MIKNMEIVKRNNDGIVILDVSGDLDIYSSIDLRKTLEELLPMERDILLNLSGNYYIDSSGLSVLIFFQKKMKERGKRFGVCCPQGYVKRIMLLTNTGTFLGVCESEEEAISNFRSSSIRNSA